MGKLTATKKALSEALDMSREARMARAREMGFDTDRVLYHGGASDFDEFAGGRRGTYLTPDPAIANIYAEGAERRWPGRNNAAPNVVPTYLRGNVLTVSDQGPTGGGWLTDNLSDALGVDLNSVPVGKRAAFIDDQARKQGYGAIEVRDISDLGGNQTQFRVLDPENIRSVNAAFDPAKSDSPNLLAGGAAAAVGLGAMTQGEEVSAAAEDFMARRQQKRSQWESLRSDLLNAIEQGVQAIEMPWRGYLGLSRLGSGLVAGEGFDEALNQAAMQARQPVEQTAYNLGGEVTDQTGSPLAGTAANLAVNLGGPI